MSDASNPLDALTEMLRRRQLMPQLSQVQYQDPSQDPNQQPQPQTQQQPNQQQQQPLPPVPQFIDPKEIQGKLPYPGAQVPNPADLTRMGANVADIASHPVVPTATTPSGQELYPRSKLKSVLLAPFMLKPMLRDPARGREIFDELTRKGYLPAEESFTRQYGQAQEQYKIARDNYKDQMEAFRAELGANKDAVELWVKQAELGMQPAKFAQLMSDIKKNEAEVRRSGMPAEKDITVHTTDGKTTSVTRQVFPPDTPGGNTKVRYIGPDGKEFPMDTVKDFRPIDSKLTGPEQYIQMGRDTAEAAGKPYTQRNLLKDVRDYQEANKDATIEWQARRFDQMEKDKVENERRMGLARNIDKTIAYGRSELKKEGDPITTQLKSIDRLEAMLKNADRDGFAREMLVAGTEASETSGGRVYRMNLSIIDSLIKSAGPADTMWARIKSYFVPGRGRVPDEVVRQIDRLLKETRSTLTKDQSIVDKYNTMYDNIDSMAPGAQKEVSGMLSNFHSEITGQAPKSPAVPAPSNLPSEDDVNKALGIQ